MKANVVKFAAMYKTTQQTADELERERAHSIQQEWSAWSQKSRISSYCVINKQGRVVAIINFKHTSANGAVECIAQRFEDYRRYWFKSKRRGYGYDRHTACLAGFHAGGVTLTDSSQHWQQQFNAVGFEVHQIL
jgi:hypothetical protein